ncbi:MAG: hypothetical protein ABI967_14150 [bacterium]
MYCSTCGVAVAPGLSYCNHCGVKLGAGSTDETESLQVRPEALVFAMMAVFIFGLGALMGLMSVMKKVLELTTGQILGVTLVIFLVMLLLEGVFIWLLLRGKRETRETVDRVQKKGPATKDLDAARARELPEHMPSVTEGTTRAFAPIPNERTSK